MGRTPKDKNDKAKDLAVFQEKPADQYLTTNHGLRVNDDQNTLKEGDRGPSLLEDFHLREKITHFDHERSIQTSKRNGRSILIRPVRTKQSYATC